MSLTAFKTSLSGWLTRQADAQGWRAIAIDGKTLRGATGESITRVHLVAAYAHEAQVVLAEL